MDIIKAFIDIILHLDHHLAGFIRDYGVWTYALLFLVIFCETGLVVTPFLPGDSLLFTVGALAAGGSLDVYLIFFLLTIAAILGDTVNYSVGRFAGINVFSRFLKQEHIDRTQRFYEKYGAKTIIFARFVPIVRTFAPFVAGVGTMSYSVFILYNVTGGLAWIASFVFGGYFFGNIPAIKRNFTAVIFVIIIISILPGLIEFIRHNRERAARNRE